MDIGRITEHDVKHALGRIRGATGLNGCPLLALDAVTERLRAAEITPTPEAQAWALTKVLYQCAQLHLTRLRRSPSDPESSLSQRELVARAVAADFAVGSTELESWSCLYHHYLSEFPLQVQELALIVQPASPHGRRLISRRLTRGYTLLADALRDLERDARARASRRDGGDVPGLGEHGPQATASSSGHPRPVVGPPANHLPRWRTSFVGREADLAGLATALVPGALVSVVGPPGAGKTRLAAEIARSMAGDGVHLVHFVELAGITASDLVAPAIATALGLAEPTEQPMLTALAQALNGHPGLLVLDNCEHLLPACASLADALMTDCPRLCLLVTSRERLSVEGEQVWHLSGLEVPGEQLAPTTTAIARSPAVQLFVARCRAADQRFQLTDGNAGAVATICRRLDGLPLALELVAARAGAVPIEALLERMDETLGRRRLPARRDGTLHGTIYWSYALLSPGQQAVFTRLGAFAGTWSLAAAQAVCRGGDVAHREVFGYLADLAEKSLLVAKLNGDHVRYRFLEPVAQVARELLDASLEAAAVRDRHLAWYLALAEEAEPALRGPDQADWLARLTATHGNLCAALRWACEKPDTAAGLRLAGALAHYWQIRGLLHEGRGHLAVLLAQDAAVPDALRAKSLDGAGNQARAQGDYPAARALLAELLTLRGRLGDEAGVAEALRRLGALADEQGEYDEATACFRRSLAGYRAIEDHWGAAAALNGLGLALYHQGRFDEARSMLAECLALFRAVGETWAVGVALGNLANVAFDQGDLAAARDAYQKSLDIAREVDDQVGVAAALNGLGHVALRLGNPAGARRSYLDSGRILAAVDDRRALAEWLEFVAAAEAAVGSAGSATRLLAAAARLREAIGAPLPDKEQAEHGARLDALRASLGSEAFEAAWAAGRSTGWRQAVEALIESSG